MGAHSKDGDGSIAAKLLIRIKCPKTDTRDTRAHHTSNEDQACHTSNEDQARHTSSEDQARHISSEDEARHISSEDEARPSEDQARPSEDQARHISSEDHALRISSEDQALHISSEDQALHICSGDQYTECQNIVDDTFVEDSESPESKDGNDNIAEEPPSCVECGKTFPSLKALYGHLRCHPLKGYRGAHRPPEPKNRLQKDAGSLSDKVPTSKKDHEGNLESDDAVVNAARILMQMSRRNEPWYPLSLRPETDQLERGKRKSISDASIKEMDEENIEGKGLQLMDAMQSENVDIEDKCIDVELSRGQEKVKKKKKKNIKYLASMHEASPPTQGSGYRCNVCSKSFPTHQALGGHRASHNKNKNSEEVDEAEKGNLRHAELVDPNNLVPRAATTEHRCTLCQATFPTGQALGGHKRKHWNPPSPPAPSPAPLSESVQKPNIAYLDIDLNEPPKLEAEEP